MYALNTSNNILLYIIIHDVHNNCQEKKTNTQLVRNNKK